MSSVAIANCNRFIGQLYRSDCFVYIPHYLCFCCIHHGHIILHVCMRRAESDERSSRKEGEQGTSAEDLATQCLDSSSNVIDHDNCKSSATPNYYCYFYHGIYFPIPIFFLSYFTDTMSIFLFVYSIQVHNAT